jgi:NurA-like 5'-3' nuclease
MGEIVEISVSEEIKEKRRKQLLIAGFFFKDGQFNLEDNVFRPSSILDLSDAEFEEEVKSMQKDKQEYYGKIQDKVKSNIKKPGELPRSICTECGKYEWNSNIIDGLCPKCYDKKGDKTPKEEKNEVKKDENAHQSSIEIEKNVLEENKEMPKDIPNNVNETPTNEGGQLKMPWE